MQFRLVRDIREDLARGRAPAQIVARLSREVEWRAFTAVDLMAGVQEIRDRLAHETRDP